LGHTPPQILAPTEKLEIEIDTNDDEPMKLVVELANAKDLMPAGDAAKCNPYCQLELGKAHKVQSTVHLKNTSP
jgi:hypothetical protein